MIVLHYIQNNILLNSIITNEAVLYQQTLQLVIGSSIVEFGLYFSISKFGHSRHVSFQNLNSDVISHQSLDVAFPSSNFVILA